MALTSTGLGAKIFASIGRRGERPDLIPARLASQPMQMTDTKGRPYIGCNVITAQRNLAGEEYLSERVHNLAFAFDRTDNVELLDGAPDSPLSIADLIRNKQQSQLAFSMSRGVGGEVNLTADPEPTAEVVEATVEETVTEAPKAQPAKK
jgi:hypothetical protein